MGWDISIHSYEAWAVTCLEPDCGGRLSVTGLDSRQKAENLAEIHAAYHAKKYAEEQARLDEELDDL